MLAADSKPNAMHFTTSYHLSPPIRRHHMKLVIILQLRWSPSPFVLERAQVGRKEARVDLWFQEHQKKINQLSTVLRIVATPSQKNRSDASRISANLGASFIQPVDASEAIVACKKDSVCHILISWWRLRNTFFRVVSSICGKIGCSYHSDTMIASSHGHEEDWLLAETRVDIVMAAKPDT